MANVRRTSLNLNMELVAEARTHLGTAGTTDTVHRALDEVIRRAALDSLAAWRFDHLPDDWLEQERSSWDEDAR